MYWARWQVEQYERQVQADLKQVGLATERANRSIKAAAQWREEDRLQVKVAALTDDQLIAYEANVNAGMEPLLALYRMT